MITETRRDDDTIGHDRSPTDSSTTSPGRPWVEFEAALAREDRFRASLGRALGTAAPEQSLAEVLHRRLGLAVAVEDAFGRVLACSGEDATHPQWTPAQRERLVAAARESAGPLRVRDRLAGVATSCGTLLGVIVVLDPEGSLEPGGRSERGRDAHPGGSRAGASRALGLATDALSLHLLHRHRLARTELRLRHDLVETVLAEPAAEDLQAEVECRVGRASALGHDLTGPHRVLALRPADGRWPDGEAVGDLLERAARALEMPFLGTLRGPTAVLVCGTPGAWVGEDGLATEPWSDRAVAGGEHEDDRGRRAARPGASWQVVLDAFARVLHDAPVVGIGGHVDRPEHLPRSYREAMHALTVRLRRTDPRAPVAFEDLGLYRLLVTPEGRRQAGAFVDDWLGSLLAYDAERQADLVHTLEVYLDQGGNYDDTAAALHIHRSTLRYRLQRIRDLSGHDLTHPDTRLNLHVAVRAAVVAEPPVRSAASGPTG